MTHTAPVARHWSGTFNGVHSHHRSDDGGDEHWIGALGACPMCPPVTVEARFLAEQINTIAEYTGTAREPWDAQVVDLVDAATEHNIYSRGDLDLALAAARRGKPDELVEPDDLRCDNCYRPVKEGEYREVDLANDAGGMRICDDCWERVP